MLRMKKIILAIWVTFLSTNVFAAYQYSTACNLQKDESKGTLKCSKQMKLETVDDEGYFDSTVLALDGVDFTYEMVDEHNNSRTEEFSRSSILGTSEFKNRHIYSVFTTDYKHKSVNGIIFWLANQRKLANDRMNSCFYVCETPLIPIK